MAEVPERIKTILAELDKAASEYLRAKQNFERARVQFEAARERFTGIKRLASEMLTWMDSWTWEEEHPDVKYAAKPIGEAILGVLRDRAYAVFMKDDDQHLSLEMNLEEIVEALEIGGFEFRTTSSLREVNAALINLEGVTKTKVGYRIADSDGAMKMFELKESLKDEERP